MRRAPWLAAPLVVLAAAGGAVALPDDPPVTPLSPADGTVVGTNPAGIATYRCPRYTSYVDLLTGVRVTEGSDHYIAGVSTSSATGGWVPAGRRARR